MNKHISIWWVRRDLRLDDNPALDAALTAGGAVLPVYIWTPEEESPWQLGGATRWWLHHSLAALGGQLRERGSRLIVRRGPSLETLQGIIQETGTTSVYWSASVEPALQARDKSVAAELTKIGVKTNALPSGLLVDPATLLNNAGQPFQVFTPFWKACLKRPEPPLPLPAPSKLPAPENWPASESLDSLGLLPKIPWDTGLRAAWQPGSEGAKSILKKFAHEAVRQYTAARDRPASSGTSRLSPHLHFGEISPRQVWHAIKQATGGKPVGPMPSAAEPYLRQIGWREFAHYLLHHFPHTPTEPLREEFAHFPWETDAVAMRAWQRGQTGYPLVDAGMRELWTTGWMHNRVRMVVASFLVKDLLIAWQEGARWFWDTLVDADLANNTLGWQWTAGCGADAAPYFRIFNPVLQGLKFDPEGDYVRHWVPELAKLSSDWIHRPWEAPAEVLRAASVTLGKTYPRPIVDHAQARKAALAALKTIKVTS